jgi:acid phosphatase family membrane protein YuiD
MCGLAYGLGSVEFAISAIMAIIVCHDAMGVRRETGKQAVILNELIKTFESGHTPDLKELVGHTPLQVIMGILIGMINALWMYYLVF